MKPVAGTPPGPAGLPRPRECTRPDRRRRPTTGRHRTRHQAGRGRAARSGLDRTARPRPTAPGCCARLHLRGRIRAPRPRRRGRHQTSLRPRRDGGRGRLQGGAGPGEREGRVFHAGGKLAKDLSLPRLRETWSAPGEAGTAAALAEWHAGRNGAPAAEQEGRETRHLHPNAGRVAAERIAEFNEGIAALHPKDAAGRAEAARELAGPLSALAGDRRDAELQRAARESPAMPPSGARPSRPEPGRGRCWVLRHWCCCRHRVVIALPPRPG
jgi:hypothetical protein